MPAITLSASQLQQNPSNKIILFGDSRIQNEYGVTSSTIINYNRGPINIANSLLDKRLGVIANKGIGGDTTSLLLARYDTDIKIYSGLCKYIYLMVDINDVYATTDLATILSNLNTLYDYMERDNFHIIDTAGYYPAAALSVTEQRKFQKISDFKKRQAAVRKNLRVIDCHRVLGDYLTSTTPSNLFFDTTLHINVRGAWLIAKELVNIFSNVPFTDKLITSQLNVRTNTDNTISSNINSNPMMVGTTGAHHATGFTINDPSPTGGFVAGVTTGYTTRRNSGTGTGHLSVGVNSKIVGQVQRFKIVTENTAGATYQFAPTSAITSRVNKGVNYIARGKVVITNPVRLHTVMLRIVYTENGTVKSVRDMSDTSPNLNGYIPESCTLTLETPILNIPTASSLTNFEVQVLLIFDSNAGEGSVIVDIGQLSVEEVG